MPDSMDDLQRQLLKTFQVEAQEHLQKLNETLLQLERQPDEATRHALLQDVFRTAHSLKGAARAVSLTDIENLAHIMENVLQQVREGKLELRPDVCDALYDALDAIQQILSGESADIDPIGIRLAAMAKGAPVPPMVAAPKEVSPAPGSSFAPGEETIRVAVSKLDDLMAQAGELIMAEISAGQHQVDVRALRDKMARWPKLWREIKVLLPRLEGDTGRRLADLITRHHESMQALDPRCQCAGTNHQPRYAESEHEHDPAARRGPTGAPGPYSDLGARIAARGARCSTQRRETDRLRAGWRRSRVGQKSP